MRYGNTGSDALGMAVLEKALQLFRSTAAEERHDSNNSITYYVSLFFFLNIRFCTVWEIYSIY